MSSSESGTTPTIIPSITSNSIRLYSFSNTCSWYLCAYMLSIEYGPMFHQYVNLIYKYNINVIQCNPSIHNPCLIHLFKSSIWQWYLLSHKWWSPIKLNGILHVSQIIRYEQLSFILTKVMYSTNQIISHANMSE